MPNTRRVVRAQLRKKKRTIRKSKRNKGPSNKKRGGMRGTTRGTGATPRGTRATPRGTRATTRGPRAGKKSKAAVPSSTMIYQELVESFNDLSEKMNTLTKNVRKESLKVPNILIPGEIKPIGYAFSNAFSSDCDDRYYIVLGYYFVKNADNKEFKFDGYMAMQPDPLILGTAGTLIPGLDFDVRFKECNFPTPSNDSEYIKVNRDLVLRRDALKSIIKDRKLHSFPEESKFTIYYVPKQT